MRTTLKDIAAKTGLSITTVSLVLNDKADKLSPDTRKRVLAAAREMHYRPNQLAISLVTLHTKTLGIVLPDITNSFFSYLVKAVEDEAARHGYHVILCHSSDKQERDIAGINMLIDKLVDGIILFSAIDSTPKHLEECCTLAKQNGVPVILLDRTTTVPGVGTVSLDNYTGGYMGMRHLLDLGHRRIGLITGPPNIFVTQGRIKGVEKALAEEGLSLHDCLIYEGDYHFDAGVRAADYFLAADITAVFSFNDIMALSFVNKVRELGVQIPRELSVVGFDDIEFARLLHVPLTTVRQPVSDMGACAAQMLIAQAQKNTQKDEDARVFMPSLVVRRSTAAAPKQLRERNRV